MEQTIKQKIEWMLSGGYLTDKGALDKRLYAYSIDLKKLQFFAVKIDTVNQKRPKKRYLDQNIPIEDVHKNMEILIIE